MGTGPSVSSDADTEALSPCEAPALYISDAKKVLLKAAWEGISQEISKINTVSEKTAHKEINNILHKYHLTDDEVASLRGNLINYFWTDAVARMITRNSLKNSAGNTGVVISGSQSTVFSGVTVSNIKEKAQGNTLIGLLDEVISVGGKAVKTVINELDTKLDKSILSYF